MELLTDAVANQGIKPKSSLPGKEEVPALRAQSSASSLTNSLDPASGERQARVRLLYSLCTLPPELSVITSSQERSVCERRGAGSYGTAFRFPVGQVL